MSALNREIHLAVQDGLSSPLPESWLQNAALAALDAALPDRNCQLTLALCDDSTIRDLNSDYRGESKVTDVLAFSSAHSGPWQGEDDPHSSPSPPDAKFPTPPDAPPYLGDVIVCLPQARRQADDAGHPLKNEIALLIIHGVLHLLGHDHYEKEEKALMWSLQNQALSTLLD